MTRFPVSAGIAALAISFASAATAAGSPVLLVDRQAIITGSKLGQNIRQQIMAYADKAQTDFAAEGQALQAADQAAGSKKSPALQAKETAFRQKVQDRQSLIQGGELAARKVYMGAVDDAVHGIMAERGASVVLEKSAAVASANGTDITADVIKRLDQKMTSFKVPLVKPSVSDQLQMMQQRRQQQQQQ